MRIAHCSDLHLLSLEGARVLDFANKRWIGGLNLLTNRGRHYRTEVFEAMVADFNAIGLDHVVCTGDVTNLALEQEFRFARERFDQIALGADEVTVIPGNHDSYIAKGSQHFREIFAPYFGSDEGWSDEDAPWPLVRIRGGVAIIGLTTSFQTPWFTAYGRIGDAQLARLREVLLDPRLAGKLRLVAIHHPPAGPRARSRIRGLRDSEAFAEVLAEAGAELVLHGHEHLDLYSELPGPDGPVPIRGIQSGTYDARRVERTARYRIFEIEDAGAGGAGESGESGESSESTGARTRPRVRAHSLRRWDAATGAFVDDETAPAAIASAAS